MLKGILRDPKKRNRVGAPARNLLTGLLVCGVCGAHMMRNPGSGRNKPYYVCPPLPRGHQCVSITQAPADRAVIDAVLSATERITEVTDVQVITEPVQDHTEALQSKLTDLARMWASDLITGSEYEEARRTIEARMKEEDMRVQAYIETVLPEPVPADVRGEWTTMTTDGQRDFIRLLITRITVLPAIKGRAFDPSRMRVSGPGISDDPLAQGHLEQLVF
jgi:site-specific DNA recombinase